jgi:hypothetical protein
MAGGRRGGPIVIPHPDDNDAGHLLDNAGSTNAKDNDSNDAPLPPPQNNGNGGGKGAGTTTVPDNNMMAAAASRDAVATNATKAVGRRGARDLRAAADDMGGFMIMCLVSFDCRVGLGRDGGLAGDGGAGRHWTIVQQ